MTKKKTIIFVFVVIGFLTLAPFGISGKVFSQADTEITETKNISENKGEFICDLMCVLPFLPCSCSDLDDGSIDIEPPRGTPAPTPTINPDLPDPDDLRSRIISEFGITMNGFNQQHLQWAYGIFADVSSTKFNELIKGTVMTGLPSTEGSRQVACRIVELGQYSSREYFQVVLIHELGHVIRNCSRRELSYFTEHARVYNSEGPVTEYARTVCGRTPTTANKLSEDYAEMITYYLNPKADEQTAPCAGRRPNPYLNGKHPLHFGFARTILGRFPQFLRN